MVGVSASVNLPLHHKVQKFASGTGPEKGCNTVVVVFIRFKEFSYYLILLHS